MFSREQLLDGVWGSDVYIDERTVDVHVGRLRKALNRGHATDPIRTVRGTGYSLDDLFGKPGRKASHTMKKNEARGVADFGSGARENATDAMELAASKSLCEDADNINEDLTDVQGRQAVPRKC